MKLFISLLLFGTCYFSCTKCKPPQIGCDIQRSYSENAAKVNISNGIWGTVSSMEGNCMPSIPSPNPSCSNCPVKRTILIYEYTLVSQTTQSNNSSIFFDSFNTQLITQIQSDNDGFFQASIAPGHYSIAIMENGKLYANERNGSGGLNPIQYSSGLQKVNLTMNYKATF
jgi:hypothetical protein